MKILCCIPFCPDNGAIAEKLCDWVFYLNGKQASGHALLVPSGDTHAELVTKVQISAELAFESVTVHVDKGNSDSNRPKPERINRAFVTTALQVNSYFNWPFLWLEPDCVPLSEGWLEVLANAYEAQPKRYLGAFLRLPDQSLCLSRVSIYPKDAINDLQPFCSTDKPFNILAAPSVLKMATKSKLFQQLSLKSDDELSKVRADSVLFHCDKKGILMASLKAKMRQKSKKTLQPTG